MKNRLLRNGLSAVFVLGLVGAAHAQTTQDTQPPGTPSTPIAPGNAGAPGTPTTPQPSDAVSKLDSADRQFLSDAAHSGALEIEGSKLALEKSGNQEVKAFAQQMIDDHTKVSQELATLAKSKGYEPPTEPSLMQKAKLKALGMRDDSFDEAYVNEIGVTAHEDAVELFQKASQEAKDPEVKQFATEKLPSLQKHLEHARTLQQTVAPAKQ